MKRVLSLLLSFTLLFTALFSYVPYTVSAEEETGEEVIAETLPEEEDTPSEDVLPEEEEITLTQEEEVPETVEEETIQEETSEENSEALSQEENEPAQSETQEETDLVPAQEEIEEPKEIQAEEENRFTVTQDPDTLDLIITTDNQELLDYFATESGSWIYFSNGGGPIGNGTNQWLRYTNHIFEVVEDGTGGQYIHIPYEALLSNQVASGDQIVSLDYNGEDYSDSVEGLQACKPLPGDIHIEENDEGLVISSDDPDFLRAVVKGSENYHVQANGLYGSRIGIDNEEIYNYTDYDRYSTYVYEYLTEINGGVLITDLDLKNKYVNNTDSFEVRFLVYGYEEGTIEGTGPITKGRKALPENVSTDFAIYQDDDGNIIINSANKEWLRDLAIASEPQAYAKNRIDGSQIQLEYYDEENGYYNSSPIRNSGYSQTLNYYYDEINEYICIPYSTVLSQQIPAGRVFTDFDLMAYGYQTYHVSLEYDGVSLEITKGVKTAPEYEIYADEETGDIVVTSEDKEWLTALAEYVDSNASGGINFQWNAGGRTFRNVIYPDGRRNTTLEFDGEAVYLRASTIRGSNVENGTYRVSAEATGYSRSDQYFMIEITQGAKAAPTDVTIEENSNGDLVISCADPEWLQALQAGWISEDQQSYINFRNLKTDTYHHISSGEYDIYFELSKDGKKLTIPNSYIRKIHLSNTEYQAYFYVYGYADLRLSDTITLTKACKSLPTDIKITTSKDKIVISSKDSAWLKAVAKADTWRRTDSSYDHEEGGNIQGYRVDEKGNYVDDTNFRFYNEKDYYNGKETYSHIEYKVNNGSITISKDLIHTAFMVSGTYQFNLEAAGYETSYNTIELESSLRTDLPDDVEVYFDEERGLVVSSQDEAWLNGITQYYSNDVMTGFIEAHGIESDRYTAFTNYDAKRIVVVKEDNEVWAKKDRILELKCPSGNYRIVIASKGYGKYYYDTPVYIQGAEQIPEDTTVTQSENGDLYISSEDERFLEALARAWKYDDEGYNTQAGSGISLYNYRSGSPDETPENRGYYFENFINRGYERHDLEPDLENHRVIVKADTMRNRGMRSGYYSMDFDVFGYDFGTKEVEIRLISFVNELSSGDKVQLRAGIGDEDVTWTSSNPNVATVSEDGMLTAVKGGITTVGAEVYKDGELVLSDTVKVTVKVSGTVKSSITSDIGTEVMVGDLATLTTDLTNMAIEQSDVVYTSNDETKAKVVSGNAVKFVAAGKAKVTSRVVGKESSISFSIYSVEKGRTLSAALTGYESGYLETGDNVQLNVYASGITDPVDVKYLSYKSSSDAIATVDEYGNVTAHKAGTTTITATLTDDPSGRKATFNVKVVNRVAESVSLDIEQHDAITKKDSTGVYIDYAKLEKDDKFNILTSALDKNGFEFTPGELKYVTTDSTVAAVDKNGAVTFKKAGQVTVTVTVSSNPKEKPLSEEIILRAVDYTPKIESNKLTVNKYYDQDVSFNVYPVYGSSISEVSLDDTGYFKAILSEDGNKVYVTLLDDSIKAKSYTETLHFKVNDSDYDYKFTVTVSSALPSVSVKTSGNFNTMTGTNTLDMAATAKNAVIRKIEFVNDNDGEKEFWIDYDEATGKIGDPKLNEAGKYVTSGNVRFYFEGYTDAGYVDKKVSFKTVSTKPSASLSSSIPEWFNKNTLVMNPFFMETFSLDLNSSDENCPITGADIKGGHEAILVTYENGKIRVALDKGVGGPGFENLSGKYTITPMVKDAKGETVALKNITLTVKVNSDLPKISLAPSSLKFNRRYEEKLSVSYKASNMPAGAGISDFILEENEVLEKVSYDGEMITFKLKGDQETKAVKGSYTVDLIPVYSVDSKKGDPIRLKVSVIDTEAKASVSIKGNLNQLDPSVTAAGTYKLSNLNDEVVDVKIEDCKYIEAHLEEGKIIFTLTAEADGVTDQTFKPTVKLTTKTGAELEVKPSIKMARKTPTVKLNPSTVNVYDTSVPGNKVGEADLVLSGVNGTIREVEFSESLAYRLEYKDGKICVYLIDGAKLKSGSTQKFTIKIYWEGDYAKTEKGVKVTSLKLSVKDVSGSIKTK